MRSKDADYVKPQSPNPQIPKNPHKHHKSFKLAGGLVGWTRPGLGFPAMDSRPW